MNKTLLLARVLRKVGNGKNDAEKANRAVGDAGSIIVVMGCLLLGAAAFFAGRFLGGIGEGLPLRSLFQTLLLALGAALLMLSILDLVNSLYMSSDNPILLAMPIKPMQLVVARMINSCRGKMLFTAVLLLPLGIGYGIAAPGLGFGFWAGLLLAVPCVTVVAVCTAASLIIVVMSVFRFIRNRDVVTVLGALLALALSFSYFFISKSDVKLDAETARRTVTGAVDQFSGAAVIFPVIPELCAAMAGEGVWHLLTGLLITAGYVLVFALIAKLLYLNSMLRMQDTGTGGRVLNNSDIQRACRQRSVMAGYRLKDLKCIFRNPVYMTNGWLLSLLWPVLLLVPMLFGRGNLSEAFSQMNLEGINELAGLSEMEFMYFHIALGLGILAAVSASGFSSLSQNVLDREGRSFAIMKTLPVPYDRQIAAKRNAGLCIYLVSSTGYLLILTLVAAIIGLPVRLVLWCLYAAAVSVPVLLFMVDLLVMHGLRKPNLNWDDESVIAKRNTLGVVIWVVVLFADIFLMLFLPPLLSYPCGTPWIPALGVLILLAVLAFIMDRAMLRFAEKKLAGIE